MAARYRFLLLDDNQDLCDMLCAVLRHRGHLCHSVGSRAEALQAVASLAPDVVIFERALRQETTVGFAQALRAQAEACGSVVLIFVVSGQPEPASYRSREPIDGYALKPIDGAGLEALVNAIAGVS